MADHFFTDIPVLFEDGDLLAVNKPEGVLSHPNPGQRPTRTAFRGSYNLEERRFQHQGQSLWLLHRLDRETSGVLLAAKSQDMARQMRELFDSQSILKKYLALVLGFPDRREGTWKDRVDTERTKGGAHSRVHRAGPPNAVLHYAEVQRFPRDGLDLLSIELLTGRTHQIRVQCAARNLPVLGDRTYGHFSANRRFQRALGLRRLFLHATRVQFTHPSARHPVCIDSPLPQELAAALERAR